MPDLLTRVPDVGVSQGEVVDPLKRISALADYLSGSAVRTQRLALILECYSGGFRHGT